MFRSWERRKGFLLARMFQHRRSCPLGLQMLYRPSFTKVAVCAQGSTVLHVLHDVSSSLVTSQAEAKSSTLFRRSWLMKGQNSSMSKQIKLCCFFVFNGFKPLDHRCRVALVIFLSKIALLILPISDLVGLISRQVGLSTKFGLQSLRVMNDTVPLAYVLTAKTNYIRSDARQSGAHIRLFCAHGGKKCATHVPLLFSTISILCITLVCKTKNFQV